MLVYIFYNKKNIQQSISRTKNQQIFVNHNQNKQNTEPKNQQNAKSTHAI